MMPRQQCNLPLQRKYWQLWHFVFQQQYLKHCWMLHNPFNLQQQQWQSQSDIPHHLQQPQQSQRCSLFPDPIPLSSSEVNRVLGLVEANPSSTNADQTVLKTVNNAVQWVTSSLLPSAASQSENLFLSAAVPLTHLVPKKVKKEIWSNEYVDFALLLNSSFTQSDDHYTFRVEKGDGGKPALVLLLNPKWQTGQSNEHWVLGFQAFVAISWEKAPHDTLALMKYGSVISKSQQEVLQLKLS